MIARIAVTRQPDAAFDHGQLTAESAEQRRLA
jgi:hypothetical protein